MCIFRTCGASKSARVVSIIDPGPEPSVDIQPRNVPPFVRLLLLSPHCHGMVGFAEGTEWYRNVFQPAAQADCERIINKWHGNRKGRTHRAFDWNMVNVQTFHVDE
ncbi:hypothetical protein DL546_001055 [Coniochaeta pulveracea]|uniref:Uncharacterized protein n=1 Tax=Coniochaeta pulveracea TaxID=177199 RepID=A0A420Y7B7_9PEZI|nr:hypothetical protein DL546_001055 [Coniochaeta pulveracea]